MKGKLVYFLHLFQISFKFTEQVYTKPAYCTSVQVYTKLVYYKSVHKTGYVMSFSMISVCLSVSNIEYHQSFQFTEQVYTKPAYCTKVHKTKLL